MLKKIPAFDIKLIMLTVRSGFFVLLLLIQSCGLMTTRPKLEMSLAASAFMAAKQSKAQNLSPGLFRKAEFYYLKAKSSYRRKYFNKAKQYAILSMKFSERAEFISKRKTALENL
ncbi:MAG TPA: DUF4398 domain-containing protein [Bacteriovoracaceae bacterium]|nr:DUF4398 domain-containing protein [Bacteriovoracaceae bacterium]